MKALQAFLLTQKWTFVLITSLCWAAAAVYYFLADPPYISEAKLMVRWVIDRDDRDGIWQPSGKNSGASIIRSEMDILTSRELAEKVAEEIGPDRLAGGSDLMDGASIVAAGLEVSNEKESTVIRITLHHADAQTAEAALKALIKAFLIKHLEIHRRLGKQSEADLMLDETVPNVAVVQTPTPGVQDVTRRNQILIVLVAGGPVLGLLVAAVLALRGRPVARPGETGQASLQRPPGAEFHHP